MMWLSVNEVKYIAFSLAQKKLSHNEPIPDFKTRYPNTLESCLASPLQTFNKKELYSTFAKKVSVLFYLMIKNHPFQNGNKRIAMTTLFLVLHINEKWIKTDMQTLYNFAVWVAGSPPMAKEQMFQYIEKFLKKYMVSIKEEKTKKE